MSSIFPAFSPEGDIGTAGGVSPGRGYNALRAKNVKDVNLRNREFLQPQTFSSPALGLNSLIKFRPVKPGPKPKKCYQIYGKEAEWLQTILEVLVSSVTAECNIWSFQEPKNRIASKNTGTVTARNV